MCQLVLLFTGLFCHKNYDLTGNDSDLRRCGFSSSAYPTVSTGTLFVYCGADNRLFPYTIRLKIFLLYFTDDTCFLKFQIVKHNISNELYCQACALKPLSALH